MRVVFDTSAVLASSYELDSPAFRNVLHHSKRLGYELVMPEVVQGELINNFEQKITGLRDKVTSAIADFEGKTGYKFQEIMSGDIARLAVHDYTYGIDKRFTEAGGIFADYPSVGHEDIARMDMKSKKPFGENKPSYRDALIWFSLLDMMREGHRPIIFITNNTKDFARSKTPLIEIYPDLSEKLEVYGLKSEEVEIITSVEEFNKRIIIPLLEVDDQLSQELEQGKVGGLDLREEIRKRFANGFEYLIPQMNPLVLSVPQPVHHVSYGGMGDMEILESRITRINSGDL